MSGFNSEMLPKTGHCKKTAVIMLGEEVFTGFNFFIIFFHPVDT
jgi:hypothetical protein